MFTAKTRFRQDWRGVACLQRKEFCRETEGGSAAWELRQKRRRAIKGLRV